MELALEDLKPFLPGLESVLDDEAVSELMVNGPGTVFVERGGRMSAMTIPALDETAVLRAAVQIARPLGRDPHTEPMIDARLGDGSLPRRRRRVRPSRSADSGGGRSRLRSWSPVGPCRRWWSRRRGGCCSPMGMC